MENKTFELYNENKEVFIQSEALKIYENAEDNQTKLQALELLRKTVY